jgi:hypothetical protein
MRKLIMPLLISLLTANTSLAQSWRSAKLEVFGGITAFQYFGDIGGASGDVIYLGCWISIYYQLVLVLAWGHVTTYLNPFR